MLRVTWPQALNYRLAVNNLSRRLPADSYVEAAYVGLQDTAPRDALLGLHARVAACEPTAWEDPRLIQTYSPRSATYVLPRDDFGVFTVGRLPRDPVARRALEDRADQACRELARQPRPAPRLPGRRDVCATGRFEVRWTTSTLHVFEQPRPAIDPEAARIELCRRHVHAFGPRRRPPSPGGLGCHGAMPATPLTRWHGSSSRSVSRATSPGSWQLTRRPS